jgi:glycosyltransferase involved in cell wall biosynthesis
MKVCLYSPWDNAWVPLYKAAFEARGHEFTFSKKDLPSDWDYENLSDKSYYKGSDFDVLLHGWADGRTRIVPGKKNIVFMRRYELYECNWLGMDWKNVERLICVSEHVANVVRSVFADKGIQTKVDVIYNAIDTKDWTFKKRRPNTNVGMACHIHPKKNIPLALQIMASLPEKYVLHIAGGIQDQWLMDYISNFMQCVRRKVVIYGQLPYEQMNLWWEQMGVCLSTSYSEGNPNNVIQAMAKGIKPLIHLWPGAIEQFPQDYLFATAPEAAQMIQDTTYDSEGYRDLAVKRFGLANIERVVDMVV